ncbi:MAG TPA: VOC family protein [Chitinophagaceae bacterium]|nr:VOC family protein [Chitinophagaceae bacterium]
MKKMLTLFLPVLVLVIFFVISFRNMHTYKQKPRINHLALFVTDLKKSTDFYQQVIGLDTIPDPFRDGKHTWFSMGGKSQLHLIAGADSLPGQPKSHHLCFSVESTDGFIENLEARSVAYENWAGEANATTTRTDGVKQLWLQDPDGYWIEINDARD